MEDEDKQQVEQLWNFLSHPRGKDGILLRTLLGFAQSVKLGNESGGSVEKKTTTGPSLLAGERERE